MFGRRIILKLCSAHNKRTILGSAILTSGVVFGFATVVNQGERKTVWTESKGGLKRRRYDVVIVGAGVAGCSTALFTKSVNPAASVLLLDAETVGAGASSHSAGTMWLPQILRQGDDISPHWDEVLASATVDTYNELEAKGYDCELERSGALLVADTSEQAKYVAEIYLDLATRGYDCKRDREDRSETRLELLTDRERLLRVEPRLRVFDEHGNHKGVHAALHLPASVHVETNKATLAIAEAAVDLGVELRENAPVTKIESVKEIAVEWIVHLHSGDVINTPRLVLACGATASKLFPEARIIPVKGQIVQSPSALPHGWLRKIIFSASAHTDFHSGKARSHDENAGIPPECTEDASGKTLTRHLYGRQKRDGYVIMGGGRLPRPDYKEKGLDYEVNEDILKDVVEHCSEILVDDKNELQMKSHVRDNSWACFMPFSLDGKPLIGKVDRYPGLFLALGLGPEGMTWGPGSGRILAMEIWGLPADKLVPFASKAQQAINPNGRI